MDITRILAEKRNITTPVPEYVLGRRIPDLFTQNTLDNPMISLKIAITSITEKDKDFLGELPENKFYSLLIPLIAQRTGFNYSNTKPISTDSVNKHLALSLVSLYGYYYCVNNERDITEADNFLVLANTMIKRADSELADKSLLEQTTVAIEHEVETRGLKDKPILDTNTSVLIDRILNMKVENS